MHTAGQLKFFTALTETLTVSVLLLSLLSPASYGQTETDLRRVQLEEIETLFADLDQLASTCLASFNLNLGEAAALLCDEFMRAIDGEPVANYLALCAELKDGLPADWKSAAQASQEFTAADATSSQQQYSLIERYCERNGLEQNTDSVFGAFNSLRTGSLLNQSVDQSMELRIKALENRLIESGERERLRAALRQSQQQRLQATQRQMNQLENELLRQQINSNPR